MWVFGYGSLVWRPDFPFAEKRPAFVHSWRRRFWQESKDHRGTPSAPGRVATLVRGHPHECCWGTAYNLHQDSLTEVVEHLDFRERGGYVRHDVTIQLVGRRATNVSGFVYIATKDNENFAGEATLDAIAAQIAGARGPSGDNAEYLYELAASLRAMDAADSHVFALEAAVKALRYNKRSMTTVRPVYLKLAQSSDEARLRDMHRRAFGPLFTKVIGQDWGESLFVAKWSTDTCQWIIGDEVGVGALSLEHERHRLHLRSLMIEPVYQGRGFAEQALRLILKQAENKSLPVELTVDQVNARAYALCKRLGFRTLHSDDGGYWMSSR